MLNHADWCALVLPPGCARSATVDSVPWLRNTSGAVDEGRSTPLHQRSVWLLPQCAAILHKLCQLDRSEIAFVARARRRYTVTCVQREWLWMASTTGPGLPCAGTVAARKAVACAAVSFGSMLIATHSTGAVFCGPRNRAVQLRYWPMMGHRSVQVTSMNVSTTRCPCSDCKETVAPLSSLRLKGEAGWLCTPEPAANVGTG